MSKSKEIKQSFSRNYILLIFLSAIISSTVAFVVNIILAPSVKKEIIAATLKSPNLISNKNLVDSKINVEYSLKDDPDVEINSFFTQTFIIKNNGNEGIENLEIIFISKDTTIQLLENPKIQSIPESIIDGLSITHLNKEFNNDYKHVWQIDLLNSEESIIFNYSAYSNEVINSYKINVLPRKKNWAVRYVEDFDITEKTEIDVLGETLNFGLYLIIVFTLMNTFIFLPLYIKKWLIDDEVRAKYNNKFFQFLWNDTSVWKTK